MASDAGRLLVVHRQEAKVVAALSQWSRVHLRASISKSTQVTKAWPRSKSHEHTRAASCGGWVGGHISMSLIKRKDTTKIRR
jgi:hypothetical protein